jgi:aryl-alcohol dehydrogenase-like predicted oxidoreductase
MQNRTLGTSNIQVAPLAFGGNVFGWTVDPATSFQLLDAFVDAGFNLIDTADVYSRWMPGHQGGESETIIGQWMKEKGNRSQVVVATKVGMDLGEGKKGLSKKYIFQAVEDSLRRLQTDYIDLYQSHTDDKETPLEETLQAYAELIQQGKVRAIGASNYDAARLSEALETSRRLSIPAYVSLQPQYNLYDRVGFEKELEPLCLKENIGVIGYYSLASGFLTGKYRSQKDLVKSTRGAKAGSYLSERGMRILRALDLVAETHRVVPASIALAWLMARKSVTAPIASATSLDQLKELTQSAQVKLSSTEIQSLDTASR